MISVVESRAEAATQLSASHLAVKWGIQSALLSNRQAPAKEAIKFMIRGNCGAYWLMGSKQLRSNE